MKGANPVAEGHLVMTSSRMMFKGPDKVNGFTYERPDEINLYKDGLRLRMGGGRAVLFKFRSVENADFIGLIVSKAQNPRMFGEDAPTLDFS
jgi:hypothetical protein